MGPLVSVILPTFEPSERIQQAVQSVIDQDVDLELIVVDDGSESDVGARLGPLRSRVRLLRAEHGGVGAARAHGLAAAAGRFVAFLDDDDTWLEGSLRERIELLESRRDAEFLLSAPLSVNPAGRLAPWFALAGLEPGSSRLLGRGEFCRIAREHGYFFLQGFLGRLESLRECGGFDVGLQASEDFDLFLRLLQRGPAVFLQKPTFCRKDAGLTGDPSKRRSVVESQLRMLQKYRDLVRRSWEREDAREFFTFHDMAARQCVKHALLDRDLRAARSYARGLERTFEPRNLAARLAAWLGLARASWRGSPPPGARHGEAAGTGGDRP